MAWECGEREKSGGSRKTGEEVGGREVETQKQEDEGREWDGDMFRGDTHKGGTQEEEWVCGKMTSLGWKPLHQRCLWDIKVTIAYGSWSLGGRSGFERERDLGTSSHACKVGWGVGGQILTRGEGVAAQREKIQGQAAGCRRVKS